MRIWEVETKQGIPECVTDFGLSNKLLKGF